MAAVCCSQRTSALISLNEAADRSIRAKIFSKDSGFEAAAKSVDVNSRKMAGLACIRPSITDANRFSIRGTKARSGPGDCHVTLDLSFGVQDRFHTGNNRYF